MTSFHWILCERSNRWAAALRMALTHHPDRQSRSVVLHEVRNLTELTDLLKEHPTSLALIEVTPLNFEAALAWLAETGCRQRRLAAVALFDGRDIATAALREAGAAEVIHSPRQMKAVLALAERHAARRGLTDSRHSQSHQSLEKWAWSLLPWQDMQTPLG